MRQNICSVRAAMAEQIRAASQYVIKHGVTNASAPPLVLRSRPLTASTLQASPGSLEKAFKDETIRLL